MLPVVLLVSVVIGRWWLVPGAALFWGVVIVATNPDRSVDLFFAAAGLAAANAAVGVLAHRTVTAAARAVRRARHS